MLTSSDRNYSPSVLHERYQIDLGEAARLIASFGSDRIELGRLLGARRVPEKLVDYSDYDRANAA